ncbi:phospholipase A [Desulfosarcina widdelii]|nr:phospholipase A [Desulfosarcina widdelii]
MATFAGASDMEIVLSTDQGIIHGGEAIIIDIYLHNNTDATFITELPSPLTFTISSKQETVSVNANQLGKEAMRRLQIPARGFIKLQYSLSIPVFARELVRIELKTVDTNPLLIEVKQSPPDAWVGQQVPIDQGQILAQSFLEDLSVHDPMYFLLGVEPGLEQSKFQLSFKYRLFNPEGYLAEKIPEVSGFYLGYTQRSIWDLENDSKPFDDTSYMPELFYLLPKIDLNIDSVTSFGIQTGFQHESNGKGGDESRSTNYLYIKPIMAVHLAGPFYLKFAPRVHTYVNNSESSNDDIMDYRGYFDLEVGIVDTQGLALNSHLWWAQKGPTVQVDLSYPMTKLFTKSLNLYLHVQYFSGYAETLLHYNERHDALRMGFSIVR